MRLVKMFLCVFRVYLFIGHSFNAEGQYHDLMQNYLYLEYGNIKNYDTKYDVYYYD